MKITARKTAPLVALGGLLLAGALAATVPGRQESEAAPPLPYVLLADQRYAELPDVPEQFHLLDLYLPRSEGPHPLVVMIHGGGWRTGDKASRGVVEPKAGWLAGEGLAMASISYSLSPPARHPDHVDDVARAIGWLADHASEYELDPERFFVMGHSAGAHLAALVSVDPAPLKRAGHELSLIQGTIALDTAAFDLPRYADHYGAGPLALRMYRDAFGPRTPGEPDPWIDPSPAHHVAAGKDIAPFLLVQGRRRRAVELLVDEFAATLKEAGVAAEVARFDKTHAECNGDLGLPEDPLTKAVGRFLRGRLEELEREDEERAAKPGADRPPADAPERRETRQLRSRSAR